MENYVRTLLIELSSTSARMSASKHTETPQATWASHSFFFFFLEIPPPEMRSHCRYTHKKSLSHEEQNKEMKQALPTAP